MILFPSERVPGVLSTIGSEAEDSGAIAEKMKKRENETRIFGKF